MYYNIDEDGVCTPTEDLTEIVHLFRQGGNAILKTPLDMFGKGARISTIFLVCDHDFGDGNNKPILFETMLFGGLKWDESQWRHTTKENAVTFHNALFNYIAKYKEHYDADVIETFDYTDRIFPTEEQRA